MMVCVPADSSEKSERWSSGHFQGFRYTQDGAIQMRPDLR
jgi:hypothetical protein